MNAYGTLIDTQNNFTGIWLLAPGGPGEGDGDVYSGAVPLNGDEETEDKGEAL